MAFQVNDDIVTVEVISDISGHKVPIGSRGFVRSTDKKMDFTSLQLNDYGPAIVKYEPSEVVLYKSIMDVLMERLE